MDLYKIYKNFRYKNINIIVHKKNFLEFNFEKKINIIIIKITKYYNCNF